MFSNITFNIVRLCLSMVPHPIHLNFKANSIAIVIKAKSSIEPCAQTGSYKFVYKVSSEYDLLKYY
jgi:hypothetical protein